MSRQSIAQARASRKRGSSADASPASPFTIPVPLPGVFPAEHVTMAQDFGGLYDSIGGLYGGDAAFPGFPALAQLAQRPEYRRLSEIIAKEMTRRWIRIVANGDEDKSERVAALTSAMEKFRVQKVFREVAEHDGFFGKGQVYLDFGSGDDPDELATPLIMRSAKVRKGSLKRICSIEPCWSYPSGYNSSDPLSRDFYRPTHWLVFAKKVHSSRLLQFVSRDVPDLLKPAYSFAGLSLSQMAQPYIENFLRTRDNVSDLVESFSTMVLNTDMSGALSGGDGATETGRAELFNALRSNRGLFLVNQDTESLSNVSAPLGGLDHLQAQSQEQIASVCGIPLIKLLGITPSGLNATSDGEIRSFYDWVEATRETLFAQHLKTVLDVIQLSEFGEVDPDIGFEFEPLWQTSEAERATIRKTNADAAAVLIGDGVLLPEEERARLANEDGGLYHGLDLSVVPEVPGNGEDLEEADPSSPDDSDEDDDPSEAAPGARAETADPQAESRGAP